MSCLYYYFKLFLMLLCLMTTECILDRFEYNFYPDVNGDLKLHYYPTTWDDAQKICAEEGAVLASPSNETMIKALNEEIRNVALWKGIHIYTGVKKLTRDYFYSIEGVPLEAMPVRWTSEEPDNKENQEDCIWYANGEIADVRCSEPLPFVCYRNIEFSRKDDCPEGYKFVSFYNKCYKLHQELRPWGEADEACTAEGGRVAKYLLPKPFGSSEVIPWSHVLNVISEYFDYHTDNVIFISFFDENNQNWSDHYTHTYSDEQMIPCAAIRIHHGVKVIAHPCNLAAPFLCESPKVKNNN